MPLWVSVKPTAWDPSAAAPRSSPKYHLEPLELVASAILAVAVVANTSDRGAAARTGRVEGRVSGDVETPLQPVYMMYSPSQAARITENLAKPLYGPDQHNSQPPPVTDVVVTFVWGPDG